MPLADGPDALAGYVELLTALGFRAVASVRKKRRTFHVEWQGKTIEAALDEVADVGQFMELELSTTEAGVEAAKACIASLASRLGLSDNERRSYLELLLANRGH